VLTKVLPPDSFNRKTRQTNYRRYSRKRRRTVKQRKGNRGFPTKPPIDRVFPLWTRSGPQVGFPPDPPPPDRRKNGGQAQAWPKPNQFSYWLVGSRLRGGAVNHCLTTEDKNHLMKAARTAHSCLLTPICNGP